MPLNPTRLWIIATPLGNTDDLSPRAKKILESVDLVLAEDTRRAARLFSRCGIQVNRCISFFEHNEEQRKDYVLKMLQSGKSIALISDAGTPLLSDPGFRLVRSCRQAGIPVSPVPGPSAPVAALSAAGLPPIPFTFLGFLPRGKKPRADIFNAYVFCPGSIVFFERPDRLLETLALAYGILGPREVCICRELTKTHEEFIYGRLENPQTFNRDLPGEITVIIGAPEEVLKTPEDIALSILEAELSAGARPRQAAVAASKNCRGWTTGELYGLVSRHNLNSGLNEGQS